jgi:5'-methylthioadenosine phosphorylase
MIKTGIIGGTGLNNPELFNFIDQITLETPFGETSTPIRKAVFENQEIFLLFRHGLNHSITPTYVNNRANIWALKHLGCEQIIATTACGSLREEIERGDLVILDQFIDFTKHRKTTFFDSFEDGNIKHTPMADPFNKDLSEKIIGILQQQKIKHHTKGTVVSIEGPRFSSRAESNMFRMWGGDVINMTTAPEVILANELEIPYVAIAISTDYDCWKLDEEAVTWEEIKQTFKLRADDIKNVILAFVR